MGEYSIHAPTFVAIMKFEPVMAHTRRPRPRAQGGEGGVRPCTTKTDLATMRTPSIN